MSQGVWTPLSGTQIGSVHVRDGRPIQDAVRTWVEGDTAVVAVADGHGHHEHFRSDVGARLAVDAAVDALVAGLADLADAATAQRAITDIAARAVQTWTAGVRQHAAENPFEGGAPRDALRPYGTTILAMAAVGDSLALFQIGDGDTVVVDSSGHASRPLPEDPDADGVTTASLCQPNPLKSLRTGATRHRAERRRAGLPVHRRLRVLARRRHRLVAADRRGAGAVRPRARPGLGRPSSSPAGSWSRPRWAATTPRWRSSAAPTCQVALPPPSDHDGSVGE